MKTIYESILGTTDSGLKNHAIFAATFKELFHKIFSNDVYEKKLTVVNTFLDGFSSVEVPVVRGKMGSLKSSFKKKIEAFAKGLSIYGVKTKEEAYDMDLADGQSWVYLFNFSMSKPPRGWEEVPEFEIGLFNDLEEEEEPNRLIIRDTNGMIKNIFEEE